jgi:hypothetical protein
MFGLEILDVVIGLMFVYLLLSLLATALNEYVSAVMNLRGKELARGLGRLLDDLDEKDALKKAFDGVGPKKTEVTDFLTERFYNHRLIRPLATRRGLLFRAFSKEPRLPSYIPARTFAMALLDVLGYVKPEASDPAAADPDAKKPAPPPEVAEQQAALMGIMNILKRESPLDVSELKGLLSSASLPDPVQVRLLEAFTGSQTRLQHLHDGVEVWFNNSMDRVSGAYKRNVQGWLFFLGLLIAVCFNADTIDMWRRLSTDDVLRKAMAERAVRQLPLMESQVFPAASTDTTDSPSAPADTGVTTGGTDTTGLQVDSPAAGGSADGDRVPPSANSADDSTTTPVDSARRVYKAARAELDSMELKLGWTRSEATRIGLIDPDSTYKGKKPAGALENPGFWAKLLGLLLTAVAISLGAPFWFDLLNKVISIRAAGRSPAEKPKSPEGGPKRTAEQTPK